MLRSPELLYLDLLKKTLSFTLWPEPPVPLSAFDYARPAWKRALVSLFGNAFGFMGVELVKPNLASTAERAEGRIWPSYADTMIGMHRLDHLQQCVETVLRDEVPGDLIE